MDWGPYEVLTLFRNYKEVGPSGCAKLLPGRTAEACRKKAATFGLKFAEYNARQPKLTGKGNK